MASFAESTMSALWSNITDVGDMNMSMIKVNPPVRQPAPKIPLNIAYVVSMTYIAPIMIVVGMVGNILALVVLQSKYFRRAPSSFILSALACADTGVLLCGFLRHAITAHTDFDVDIRQLSEASCWIHVFSSYYLKDLASWSLVLLTVERMVSVKWPFKAKELISKTRMVIAWLAVALVLFLLNVHFISNTMTMTVRSYPDGTSRAICDSRNDATVLYFHRKVWPWLDLVKFSLAPLAIVIACNVIIITTLLTARKARQDHMRVSAEDDSSSITAMLIGISIMFVWTTVPVSVYFIGKNLWPASTYQDVLVKLSAYAAVNVNYYLSSCTNFIIYCISGSKFRRALVAVVLCREIEKSKSKKPTSSNDTAITSVSEKV